MLGRCIFVIIVFVIAFGFAGCGKKQQSLEEMQEPLSIEALSALNVQTAATPETKAAGTQVAPQGLAQLEPLPPAGPYKPTVQEIQTALKNAGFYTGEIDGKKGPLTKKAIEDFQKANNLKTDGKVGPQTWAVLSAYLHPPTETKAKKKR